MALQPGSFVAGRYRVTRLIGQGSMGEVWEAVHTMTERPVALKVLLDGTSSLEARARILREARACGRIQHRNVIEVFDVGEVDDHRPFLVMPLLSGQTLEDHIDTRGPLSEEEALTVGLGVARALVAAHDLGIVHRDLKPANVFLHWEREASEPIVKVLDFGISKILSRDEASFTDAGRAVGSPAYMSPEQARGESDVDARTDIWSFGVLLFEALTAKLPFPGETPYAIVGHILHGEMPDFDTLCPNVRPGVRDLLRRCVMKDRGSRIPTARDLVGFLEAVMGRAEPPAPARWSTGATTSRVPLPASATATASALVTQKVEIPRPRSRARLLVIAGAALATVGGLAVAYVTTRPSGDPVRATATAPPSADPGVASQTEPVALPTSTSEASAPASSEPPVSAPPSAEPSASPTVRPAPPRPRPTSKPSKKSALPDSPG